MNLEAERIQLIDISSEDDFLIDSQSDSSSLDLRLSVAFETQTELVLGRAKLMDRPVMNNTVPLFPAKEQETFYQDRENGDNECSLRKSLAWDRAFFTSPGFLELEELCLVNRGFKDFEVPLLHETQDNIRSKVCQERSSNHKSGLGTGSRQRTQSFMKQKLTSSSKMTFIQDSKQQHMNTKRSVATSGVVRKSHAVQRITDRRESLKSTRTESHNRVSTMHSKKPPLKGVSKNGENGSAKRLGMMSRRPKSWSVNSVSSSQPLFSSNATNNSIEMSPPTSTSSDAGTANVWSSQEIGGECLLESSSSTSSDSRNTGDIVASPEVSPCNRLAYDPNASHHRSPIDQGSLGKSLLRQAATRETRRSPLLADVHRSSKPSSLRLPSGKIGFFDMKSEGSQLCPEAQSTCTEGRASNECRSVQATKHELKNRIKDIKPKEVSKASFSRKPDHIEIAFGSHDQDGIKPSGKGHTRRNQHHLEKPSNFPGTEEKENMFVAKDTVIELELKKSSPSPSKFCANGSSTGKQYSSSSGKRLCKKAQRPTMLSTAAGTRIPFSTSGSPLKRSAFF